MRSRKTLIIALVSGLLCAVSVFAFTQSVRAESDGARAEALERYGGEQMEVVVATKDIAPGETAGTDNTETKLWLADLLPVDPIESLDTLAGKKAQSSIVGGEVLTMRRFDNPASGIDIPEGLSALSLPAKAVEAVGGAVSTGNVVDIYLAGDTETKMISKETLVVATSVGENSGSSAVSWITVAVKPESVQELIAASEKGDLHFVIPAGKEKEGK